MRSKNRLCAVGCSHNDFLVTDHGRRVFLRGIAQVETRDLHTVFFPAEKSIGMLLLSQKRTLAVHGRDSQSATRRESMY
jgi:hypothetical protein